MNNNNSGLTTKRRKFLTMAVGTTLGFSIPYIYTNIENTNNLVRAGCPGCTYVIEFLICAGIGIIAKVIADNNKSQSFSISFEISPDSRRNKDIEVNFTLWVAYWKDGRYYRVDEKYPVYKRVSPNGYWSESYSWKVDNFQHRLYLSISKPCSNKVERYPFSVT
jgi:hypothetical protein